MIESRPAEAGSKRARRSSELPWPQAGMPTSSLILPSKPVNCSASSASWRFGPQLAERSQIPSRARQRGWRGCSTGRTGSSWSWSELSADPGTSDISLWRARAEARCRGQHTAAVASRSQASPSRPSVQSALHNTPSSETGLYIHSHCRPKLT